MLSNQLQFQCDFNLIYASKMVVKMIEREKWKRIMETMSKYDLLLHTL